MGGKDGNRPSEVLAQFRAQTPILSARLNPCNMHSKNAVSVRHLRNTPRGPKREPRRGTNWQRPEKAREDVRDGSQSTTLQVDVRKCQRTEQPPSPHAPCNPRVVEAPAARKSSDPLPIRVGIPEAASPQRCRQGTHTVDEGAIRNALGLGASGNQRRKRLNAFPCTKSRNCA